MDYKKEFMSFINNSPVSFYAVKNVKDKLLENGFIEVFEGEDYNLQKGGKYFVVRDDGAIISFKVGEKIDENSNFLIIASHSDSPCFRLKEEFDVKDNGYSKVLTKPYGGMLLSTWVDRPLSVAGKLVVNEEGKRVNKLVNIDKDLFIIPNLCIHFLRDLDVDIKRDIDTFMVPFYGSDEEPTLMDIISHKLQINKEDIIEHELYAYNRDKVSCFGNNDQFIYGPRLDDLACVYTSLVAFLETDNPYSISMIYVANNEEIGSDTYVGAGGDFFVKTLESIKVSLNINDDMFKKMLENTFFVSSDNAHAVHPNVIAASHPEKRVLLNGGLAIKRSETNSYTTNDFSSALCEKIFNDNNIKYQHFANPIGVRGGSTLGVILLRQQTLVAVDVGIPQLAMHSSFESMGTEDIVNAIEAFKAIYLSKIQINNDKFEVEYLK